MITVVRAPPFATLQDRGRFGYRGMGVPIAGAMDQWALGRLNALLGNSPHSAVLEYALGEGLIAVETECVFALGGPGTRGTLNGSTTLSPYRLCSARKGDEIRLDPPARQFAYLGVAGGFAGDVVLGSRSTYLPAGFGGFAGRSLRNGDTLHLLDERAAECGPAGAHTHDMEAPEPDYASDVVRLILRHDYAHANAFLASDFAVSRQLDRTGYRLASRARLADPANSVTSQPTCPGTIQLPPNGDPVVLMADAPTIGGYRQIGVVLARDLPLVAQKSVGERLRFRAVSIRQAADSRRQLVHDADDIVSDPGTD